MEQFICPDCGSVSYTAYKSNARCPYCTELVIVLSNQFLEVVNRISEARFIFDRRQKDRRQELAEIGKERRVSDRRKNDNVVMGWAAFKKKGESSEKLSA